MLASKLRGPMSIAVVNLKIWLGFELFSTTWLQATDWFLLQVHRPDMPGQTPWISKRSGAVGILALQFLFSMSN